MCVIHDITRSSPSPRSCACRAPRRRTRGSRTRTEPAARDAIGASCHRHRNVVVRERKPALERRPRDVVLCHVTPPSETDRTRAKPSFGIYSSRRACGASSFGAVSSAAATPSGGGSCACPDTRRRPVLCIEKRTKRCPVVPYVKSLFMIRTQLAHVTDLEL